MRDHTKLTMEQLQRWVMMQCTELLYSASTDGEKRRTAAEILDELDAAARIEESETPSDDDVQRMATALRGAYYGKHCPPIESWCRIARRALELQAETVAGLRDECDAAIERAKRAEKELADAREEWRDLAEDFGLPPDLSPQEIRELADSRYYDVKTDKGWWKERAERKEKILSSILAVLSECRATKP